GQQAFLAGDGIDDDHECDEEERVTEKTATAAGGGRCLGWRGERPFLSLLNLVSHGLGVMSAGRSGSPSRK
ncbi:MAG TPA: hypothetical protein VF491_15835, partial [Vicinamibacterales bacterium]